MRAADALEKIARERIDLLQPHAEALLGLLVVATQQEVRWHLALILPRLQLKPAQRRRVAETLKAYLDDRSSIVKTCALQGLADLTAQLPSIRAEVIEVLQDAVRRGTPAMRARGRRLLAEFERGAAKR